MNNYRVIESKQVILGDFRVKNVVFLFLLPNHPVIIKLKMIPVQGGFANMSRDVKVEFRKIINGKVRFGFWG